MRVIRSAGQVICHARMRNGALIEWLIVVVGWAGIVRRVEGRGLGLQRNMKSHAGLHILGKGRPTSLGIR